jgi:hypothetical protein
MAALVAGVEAAAQREALVSRLLQVGLDALPAACWLEPRRAASAAALLLR